MAGGGRHGRGLGGALRGTGLRRPVRARRLPADHRGGDPGVRLHEPAHRMHGRAGTVSRISFPRSARGISTAFNLSAGLLLLVLMVLTVVDVLGRSMFGQSVLGTVDISTLLLVAIAFLGLASAEIDGRHVSVTLLEGRFGFRTRMVFSGVRAVLLLGVGAVVVWGLGDVMLSAFERGETTNDI